MARFRINLNVILGACILILWFMPIYSDGNISSGWQLSLQFGWPGIFPILALVFLGSALLQRLWVQAATIVLLALAADVVLTLTDGERYFYSASGLLIFLTVLCALMSTLHAVLHRLLPERVATGEAKSLIPIAALVIAGMVLAPVYYSLSSQSRDRNWMYLDLAGILHLPNLRATRQAPTAPIKRAALPAPSRAAATFTSKDARDTDVAQSATSRQCSLAPVVENGWSLQAPGSMGLRRFDWLVSANDMAVVTVLGELYVTRDNGESWLHGRCGTLFRFDIVRFLDATTAWALGKVKTADVDRLGIARTRDGGATWEVREIIPRPNHATGSWVDLHLWDTRHAIAVGSNEVLTTTDGGETWHRTDLNVRGTIAAAGFGPQQSVWLDESDGVRSAVHRTLDGGRTWVTAPGTLDPAAQQVESWKSAALPTFDQLGFASPTFGVALTPDARLLMTRDGGRTWQHREPAPRGTGVRVTAMTLTGPQSAKVIIASQRDAGLYGTEDAGETWQWISATGYRDDLAQLQFADASRGWRLGIRGTLERTADAGLHWTAVGPFNTNRIRALSFVDASSGWMVGDAGTVLHTTDGGRNWVWQSVPLAEDWIAARFVDPKTGWLLSSQGAILRTRDGGAHWASQRGNLSSQQWNDLYMVDADRGWAVGSAGHLMLTTDGGAHWTVRDTLFDETLYRVAFADRSAGWAVGERGIVVHSIDGGGTWEDQPLQIGDEFVAISVLDRDNVWIASKEGHVFHTRDGGRDWQPVQTPATPPLQAMSFTDQTFGWLLADGVWFRTCDSGHTWKALNAPTGARFAEVLTPDARTFLGVDQSGQLWLNRLPTTTLEDCSRS